MLAVPPPVRRSAQAAEIREQIAQALALNAETIVWNSVTSFSFAGINTTDATDYSQLAGLLLQLLVGAVRQEARGSEKLPLADLRCLASEANIEVRTIFGLEYVIERSVLGQLTLEESLAATSESWAEVTQIIRRASFDVLAAFAEESIRRQDEAPAIDSLTGLLTKTVFVAALEKEIQRSERSDHPFALILLDVDHLADINATHGHGTGDRVLERIAFLVRSYFREQDWVARSSDDTFAVLLPATHPRDAEHLADQVRTTIEQRFDLHDYRLGQRRPVTVSVGVLIAQSVDRSVRPEHLLMEAQEAIDRAKRSGRNRVELIEATVPRVSPPSRASQPLG